MPQQNRPRIRDGLLQELYEGTDRRAVHFRYALLLFDVATLVYLVATSFIKGSPALEMVDALIGFTVLAEFIGRLSVSRHRLRDLVHPLGLADLAVIVSFLAPISGQELGFLRVLRALRLFRSYRVATRMRQDSAFVRRHYDTIVAGTHLFVFLFLMTAIVYQTQYTYNAAISNYLDALYFTVTTLTTTGFGDITLTGTAGRLLSIVMMLVGVSLFLRLVQVLLRPARLHQKCSSCGLSEHETDAAHCRRCGALLVIDASAPQPTEMQTTR
jgi:voltage-gated potassium channel